MITAMFDYVLYFRGKGTQLPTIVGIILSIPHSVPHIKENKTQDLDVSMLLTFIIYDIMYRAA